MNLNIISPGIRVSGEFETIMRRKFAGLEKIYNHITGYEIVLRKTEAGKLNNCEIECHVLIPKSAFICRERADDFYAALDQAIENLTRQLKNHKEGPAEIW